MTPFCIALVRSVALCVDHFSLALLLRCSFLYVTETLHSYYSLLCVFATLCFHFIRSFISFWSLFSTHILEFRVRWVIHSNYRLLSTALKPGHSCVLKWENALQSQRKSIFFSFLFLSFLKFIHCWLWHWLNMYDWLEKQLKQNINDFAHFDVNAVFYAFEE